MLLVLGDSLGLPRRGPEYLTVKGIYPSKLSKELDLRLFNSSQGAATSQTIVEKMRYFDPSEFDILILHVGIVDCTPRPFSKLESYILKALKIKVSTKISGYLRRIRSVQKVKVDDFAQNLLQIREYFKENEKLKILALPIVADCEGFASIGLKNMELEIQRYNDVISKVFGPDFIELSVLPEYFMSDFHHLNESGHNYIFQTLLKILK